MSEENGADVDLNIAGQKVALKNVKSLNTIVSLIAAVAACFGVYLVMAHASDTKDAGKELVLALKEMTQAAREQNCLMAFPQEKREVNADLCKRLSR